MQGLHLTADLTDCQCEPAWLTDAVRLVERCLSEVNGAGLQAVSQLAHTFVHTWPEQAGVTVDEYLCNFGGDHSTKAHALMDALVALFAPQRVLRQALARGCVAVG